jgi:hypothetical protein
MSVIELFTWLAGAGVSAVSAFMLERLSGFHQLSPNAKQLVAMSIAVAVGALSIAARDYLVAQPDVANAIEPYAQMLIAAASIIVQQVAHGLNKGLDDNG